MKAYLLGAAVVVGVPVAREGGGGLEIGFLVDFTAGGVRRRRREVVKNRDGPTGCAGRGRVRRGRAKPREKLAIELATQLVFI